MIWPLRDAVTSRSLIVAKLAVASGEDREAHPSRPLHTNRRARSRWPQGRENLVRGAHNPPKRGALRHALKYVQATAMSGRWYAATAQALSEARGCRGRRRDTRILQVGSGITAICGEAGMDGRRWSLALYSPRRRAPFSNDLRKDRLGYSPNCA
jgi:hypothetical protein